MTQSVYSKLFITDLEGQPGTVSNPPLNYARLYYNAGTNQLICVDSRGNNLISGGSGAVSSVFGRTGNVVAASGDYNVSQVTNAAATPTSGDYLSMPAPDRASNPVTNSAAGYLFARNPAVVQCFPFFLNRSITLSNAFYQCATPIAGTNAYFGIWSGDGLTLLKEIKISTATSFTGSVSITPVTLPSGNYIWGNGSDETYTTQATTITNIALTSNVVTITCSNTFQVGQIVFLYGIGTAIFLNGQRLTITAATPTSFTAAFTHANYVSASDTGTVESVEHSVTMGGYAFDSNFMNCFGYRAANVISGGHLPATVPNGAVSDVSIIINVAIASNVVTLTCTGEGASLPNIPATFIAGASVTILGMSVATFLNSQTLTISSISGNNVIAAFTHADYTSAAEFGVIVATAKQSAQLTAVSITNSIATITATNTFTPGMCVIIGSNTAASLTNYIAAVLTASGSQFTVKADFPNYPYIINNIALTTNVVTVSCNNALAIGNTVTLAGLTTATYLNGQTLTVSTVTTTQFTAAFVHGNDATHTDTGTVTNSIFESGVAVASYTGNNNYLYSSPNLLLY